MTLRPAPMHPRCRRLLLGVLFGLLPLLFGAGTAFADPAGPTDYRSTVVSIVPDVPGFDIEIIGGDSFVLLTVDQGVEVMVPGYFAEPYLWFRPDGTVLENRNSPTTYQNEERYGADAPDFASAEAEPDWVEVASDGSYAWHDHRAHWMQPIRPAGAEPGDQILEQVIPLVVDGTEVDVKVISVWLDEPSVAPLLLGAVVGLGTLGAAVLLARSGRPWPASLIPVALLASVVGVWQFVSLPSETDPRIVWPVLPVLAAVAVVASAVLWRSSRFMAGGAALVGAVQLVVWAAIKRDGLSAAIVPTDAPQWLDRSVVVAAFVAGLGVGVLALREIFLVEPGTRRVPAAT